MRQKPLHAQSICHNPRPQQRSPAGTISLSALAVSSPFSVWFILQDNIPERGDHCEVLAAYRWDGGQQEVLTQLKLSSADGSWDEQCLKCPGSDCQIFRQSCQVQRLNQPDQISSNTELIEDEWSHWAATPSGNPGQMTIGEQITSSWSPRIPKQVTHRDCDQHDFNPRPGSPSLKVPKSTIIETWITS